MSKDLRETNKRKGNMKLQLEKKGVPWGNRLAKGTSIFRFLPRFKQPTGCRGKWSQEMGRPTPEAVLGMVLSKPKRLNTESVLTSCCSRVMM